MDLLGLVGPMGFWWNFSGGPMSVAHPSGSGGPAEIFFKIVTHVEIDNVELSKLPIKSGDS